jgi:hypothetical protein
MLTNKYPMMRELFLKLKSLLAGKWEGEGFAQYPTIENTHYTESLAFTPDKYKDAIHFEQKTLYKNSTEKNGQTVFWDTGFILLPGDKILLISSQVGGRQETYELAKGQANGYQFDSVHIKNDLKQTIRSQRIFIPGQNELNYALNMASHASVFQNHLTATLKRVSS